MLYNDTIGLTDNQFRKQGNLISAGSPAAGVRSAALPKGWIRMLKLLACLCMLLDHIGYYFHSMMPQELYILLRCVGRLAFPIFAWSVALGYKRTRSPVRYFIRMAIFAAVTEIVFIFAHHYAGLESPSRNIMITFSLAIVLIAGFQMALRSSRDMIASLRPISPTPNTLPCATRYDVRINIGGIELDRRIGLPLGLFMMLAAVTATIWLKPDYDLYGLLSVLMFFAIHDCLPEKEREKRSIQGFAVINIIFLIIRVTTGEPVAWPLIQCLSILALPICYARIKEPKPPVWAKYAFYLFYPLHIALLLFIRTLLIPA
jgi:hypothetical protein